MATNLRDVADMSWNLISRAMDVMEGGSVSANCLFESWSGHCPHADPFTNRG